MTQFAADRLLLFGATGDLARRKLLPSPGLASAMDKAVKVACANSSKLPAIKAASNLFTSDVNRSAAIVIFGKVTLTSMYTVVIV